MKILSNLVYYFFWALGLITLYAFLRQVNDAGDFDVMNIGRHRFLNGIIPTFIFPIAVILFSVWIFQLKKYSHNISPTNKFLLKKTMLPSPIWWIPFIHFVGASSTLNFIGEKMKDSTLEEKDIQKIKSGGRWIKVAFGLFYTICIAAFLYYFFVETNKDGHDFFLTTLFLFILIFSIGVVKISSACKNLAIDN